MAKKFYKTEKFRKLEAKWYCKLEKIGFEDAEDSSLDYRPLKAWHSSRFCREGQADAHLMDQSRRQAQEEYYRKAVELLNTYEFANETHRKIWELHSEGWSKRQIERAIKPHKPTYKREQIGNIIGCIAKEIK